MDKLRIHVLKYRNRGMANRKLKGQQEYHVIFKFDTEPEAKDFIAQVKEFWYSRESVKDKVIDVINKTKDERKPEIKTPKTRTTQKPVQKKRPGPAKGTGGRPKKNLQRQGR